MLLRGGSAVGEHIFFIHAEGLLPLFLKSWSKSFDEAIWGWIDVDEVNFAWLIGERAGEVAQASLEHGSEERIVKIQNNWAGGIVDCGGVAGVGFNVAALLPRRGEARDVGCGDGAELQ